MLRKYRVALYTFGAVFLAVAAMCTLTLPLVLDLAQQTYYELQKDVTERQARAMERFLLHRLERGVPPAQVVAEFQDAIEGSELDRGYVCLIDQQDVRYLSHPDRESLGMAVKPGAMFDRDLSGRGVDWAGLISVGEEDGGVLDIAQGTMREIVHFMTVPGTDWTVSAHENSQRIDGEIRQLRRALTAGGLLFALLLAAPASIAARRVSRHRERQVERANRLERQLLEHENQRKADELESARRLQLSMLPESLPDHPQIELAAEMKTATEVGGDYYDVDLDDDGTLTVIVGDATGHGLQGGTMVATAKGLFTHCARQSDLAGILDQIGDTILRVGLPRLFMAAGLARFRGRALELVGSGLPPALVYRAATGTVEQITLAGIPLGSRMRSTPTVTETELVPGDAVVLLTDGLPELLDADGCEFGYDRLLERVSALGSGTAGEIAAGLRRAAREWAGERTNDDDVTVMVMRFRPEAA